jgi:2-keto-4-pentenoate hydratase/2-oxohepta-3-ene-1,7-dioic acid hydratase in catechol pathway
LLFDDLKAITKRNYQGLSDTVSEIMSPISDNMLRKDVNSNLRRFNKFLLDGEDLQFLPCVLNPRKIVCIGLNYRRHAKETGASIHVFPVIFSKFSDAVTGHREEIELSKTCKKVDYEAELVIVMGHKAFLAKNEDVLEQVYGYFPANDISARDLQFTSG